MRNLLGLRMEVFYRYVISLLMGTVVIFSVPAYAGVEDSPALHPALQWVNNNLIRGTWIFGLAHMDEEDARQHIQDLSQAGLNTVFTGFWIRLSDCPAAIRRGLEAYEPVALAIAESGMKCWFMVKPAFRMTLKDREGIPYKVNLRGEVLRPTPCPFDIKFIRGAFGKLAVEVARRAEEWNLFGIVYDFEINFADGRCFCAGCLRGFLKEEGRPYPEEIKEGKLVYDYLVANNLLKRFQARQMNIITSEFRKIREEVHQLAPNLMFAFYHYNPTPIYHAVIKGLGKEELPVVVLYDFTYLAGFTERFLEDQARARELGLPAIFAGGLWLNQFMPENLPGHAYHIAVNSAGYWLWTTAMLAHEGKGALALPGDCWQIMRQAYWEAISLVGREIDKWLEDPSHETALELKMLDIFRPIARDLERRDLRPLQERIPGFRGEELGQTDFRGGISRLFTYLEKGEEMHLFLECAFVRGMDAASFLIFDPRGAFQYEGGVPVGTTREIKLTAHLTGTYTIKVQPTDNVARVRLLNQYMVIQTPFHIFRTPAERYYFYVPEEVKSFQVYLVAAASREAARLRIFDPAGKLRVDKEGEFNVWTPFELESIKEGKAEIWSLSISEASFGILEDIVFKFSANIPPFVSDAPERLLLPKILP